MKAHRNRILGVAVFALIALAVSAGRAVAQDSVPARSAQPEEVSCRGTTPGQCAVVRRQLQTMRPEVLPLRVIFAPHWKYVANTRIYHLHVPAGFTCAMFTHLPSRTIFIDEDRRLSDDALGYWLAHELGHLATMSVREADAERAGADYRKRLKATRLEFTGESFSINALPSPEPQGTQPAQPNSDFAAKLVLVHSEEEFHRWNAASPEARAKSGGTINLHPGEKSMAFALVAGSGVSNHHLTAQCMLQAPEPAEPLFDDNSRWVVAFGRYTYNPDFTPHPPFHRGWEDCLVETRTNRKFPNAAMLVLVLFSADHDAKSTPGTWKLSADYETKAPATWNLQVRIRDDSNGQIAVVEGQIALVPDKSPDTSNSKDPQVEVSYQSLRKELGR